MNIFIAGPRAVSKLNKDIKTRLQSIMGKGITVLVGDANGIDKAVQNYLHESNYNNVVVYSCAEEPRNNLGGWQVNSVIPEKRLRGFKFYQQKDIAMAKDADYGFMIWNAKSKGTFSNIVNLVGYKKRVLVYFLPEKRFINIDNISDLLCLVSKCSAEIQEVCHEFIIQSTKNDVQLTLFDFEGKNE